MGWEDEVGEVSGSFLLVLQFSHGSSMQGHQLRLKKRMYQKSQDKGERNNGLEEWENKLN